MVEDTLNKNNSMTVFLRYYNEDKILIEKSMSDMERLISDENNRREIANLIYHRLFVRSLKLFFYKSPDQIEYKIDTVKKRKNVFETEYKNGFLMMTCACSLIESLASYLQGNNWTVGIGKDNFDIVFKKCENYGNELKIFFKKNIYKSIRNGLLHQGETYDKFKISRTGTLFNKTDKKINATLFIYYLNEFLLSYKSELEDETTRWDSEIWDNCRAKIRHIISNSRN